MEAMDIVQSVFRWIHVVAGILWIGHLYFFNWVNGPMAAVLDGETKKKVVPELMPRALFWFRYGALWTWATGILLLLMVFYHGGLVLQNGGVDSKAGVIMVIVLIAPFVYDALMKGFLGKNPKAPAIGGLVLIALFVMLMVYWAGFGYRAYNIHVGSLFGTIMAYNVWFRIWPNQQKIIAAVKAGTPPDAALVATAGARSKHNTYMSIPLVWTMINGHTTWASTHWAILIALIAVSWIGTSHLYKKAGKVKGL